MPILKILEEDTSLPISLDEIKLFLKVDYNEEDELIKRALKTAIKQCEFLIGQTLIEKKYLYSIYNLNKKYVNLPYGSIKNIVSVKIIDNNNLEKEINNYFVDTVANSIVFSNIFSNFYRLDIIYVASAIDISEDLKEAIFLHTLKIFEDKLSYSPIPIFSLNVYKNYKIKRL